MSSAHPFFTWGDVLATSEHFLCLRKQCNQPTNEHLLVCHLIRGMFTLANDRVIKHSCERSCTIIDSWKRALTRSAGSPDASFCWTRQLTSTFLNGFHLQNICS